MADDEYERKLESLQKYIPFLNNMISQLKDPNKKNRELQLNKMESLHAMITDRKKKLKLDTLCKCEDVILKLYEKVNNKPLNPKEFETRLTPASPSPPRELTPANPVMIPTEKIGQHNRVIDIENTIRPRVDVYSSAAESLQKNIKKDDFNIPLRTDMSKPPISLDDLKSLEDDVHDKILTLHDKSLDELQDLKESLSMELEKSLKKCKLNINTTARNVPHLKKQPSSTPDKTKVKEKSPDKSKIKEHINKSPTKVATKEVSPSKTTPKILKNPDSIFGSLLSNIDSQLLEGKKKTEHRRSSSGHRDESKSKEKSKDHHKKSSKSKHYKTSEYKKVETNTDKSKYSSTKDNTDTNQLSDSFHSRNEKHIKYASESRNKNNAELNIFEGCGQASSDDNKSPGPVFKRLADKYNPKPRKPSTDVEIDKKVINRIEESMKTSNYEVKVPDPPIISNTTNVDASIIRKLQNMDTKMPPLPVPPPDLTSLINSNTTAIINQVVSQFKVQTPISIINQLNVSNNIQPFRPPSVDFTPSINQQHSHNNILPVSTPITDFTEDTFDIKNPNTFSFNSNRTTHNFQNRDNQFGNYHQRPLNFIPPQQRPNFTRQNSYNEDNYFPQDRTPKHFNNSIDFEPRGQLNFQPPDHFNYNRSVPPIGMPRLSPQDQHMYSNEQIGYPGRNREYNNYDDNMRMQPPELERMCSLNVDPRRNQYEPNQDRYNNRSQWVHGNDQRFQRDPRNYREYKEMQMRESRELKEHKDNTRENRDPRLNRDPRQQRDLRLNTDKHQDTSNILEKPPPRQDDSRLAKERTETKETRESRFDSIYKNKSKPESKNPESIVSPLDSLYNNEKNKTGKGYGVQNFKIPKKKKDISNSDSQLPLTQVDVDQEIPTSSNEQDSNADVMIESTVVESKDLEGLDTKLTKTTEENNVNGQKEKTDKNVEKEIITGKENIVVEPINKLPSQENEVEEKETQEEGNTSKPDSKSEQSILAQFFANLMDSENKVEKKGALLSLLSTFSSSFSGSQLKRITKIIKQDSSAEEDSEDENNEKSLISSENQSSSNNEIDSVELEKSKTEPKPKAKAKKPAESPDILNETIEDNQDLSLPKKKYKHKTELDLLHEDIQEMFIRDGVLTANGQRMCRMLKSDPQALSSGKPVKQEKKKIALKSVKKKTKKLNLKSMPTVQVVINKMTEDICDPNKRSLRRKQSVQYLESEETVESESSKPEDNDLTVDEHSDNNDQDSPEQSISTRVKGKRKRKSVWASGFTKKIKKKKTSTDKPVEDSMLEPDSPVLEDMPLDTNLSLDVKSKLKCHICNYNGKFIAQHYRMSHPEEEVFTSRMPPEKTKEAIEDAKLNMKQYDIMAQFKDTGKHEYHCRICNYNSKVYPFLFYEHITLHTGEFRHGCTTCNYVCSTVKSIKHHEDKVHPEGGQPALPCKMSNTILFAFVCEKCNYFQIDEDALKRHVRKFHGSKNNLIHKINLSTFIDKNLCDANKLEELKDSTTKTDEKSTKEAKSKVLVKKRLIKKKTMKKQICSTPKRPRTESKNEETQEIAPNVEDRSDEGVVIPFRQQRAAKEKAAVKMKELLDENDERLSKKQKIIEIEEKATEEDLKTPNEEEHVDNSPELKKTDVDKSPELENAVGIDNLSELKQPPVVDVSSKLKEVEDVGNPTEFKKSVDKNVFTCETDINEENDKIHFDRLRLMEDVNKVFGSRNSLNIADKLSSRLSHNTSKVGIKKEMEENPENTDSQRPISPTMPILEKVLPKKPLFIEDPIVQPSMTEVSQKNNNLIDGMINKLKDILQTTTSDSEAATFVDDGTPLLVHVNQLSVPAGTTVIFTGCFMKVIKKNDHLTYCCQVPPCIFATEKKLLFMDHCKEHAGVSQRFCEVCGEEIKNSSGSISMEDLFTHVCNSHVAEQQPKPPILLKMRRLSGDILSSQASLDETYDVQEIPTNDDSPVENVTMGDLENAAENPFSFKISEVMSLANSIPPLSPISSLNKPATSTTLCVIQEIQPSQSEQRVQRKSRPAMKKFLTSLADLYKCPEHSCQFSTSFRDFFDTHIENHKHLKLVYCVYCNVKTPVEQLATHMEIRHSHCRYSCTYCLYRAVSKEYVILHQEMFHKKMNIAVRQLPIIKLTRKIYVSQPKIEVRQLCRAFSCKECKAQFLFENDFKAHIMGHPVTTGCNYPQCNIVPQKSAMVAHWNSVHGICKFQCGYCNVSQSQLEMIFRHQAFQHPHMDTHVLERDSKKFSKGLCYSNEAIALIKHRTNVPANVLGLSTIPDSPTSITPAVLTTTTTPEIVLTKILDTELNTPPVYCEKPSERINSPQDTIEPMEIVTIVDDPVDETNDERLPESEIDPLSFETEENTSFESHCETASSILATPEKLPRLISCESMTDSLSINTDISFENNKANKSMDHVTLQNKQGLKGEQLFRCAFCSASYSTVLAFKQHVSRSATCKSLTNISKPFECVHCGRFTKSAQSLVEHIQYHGTLRYHCSLCEDKFPSMTQIKNHMKCHHNVSSSVATVLCADKINKEEDEYILKPKSVVQIAATKEVASVEKDIVAIDNMVFKPDQINNIPMSCIFTIPLKCGLCNYTNKVRTNFIRHLKFHLEEKAVPDSAPVNPVPCLDKNEKMFDKMTNLAYNGFQGGKMGGTIKEKKEKAESENIPEFVPTTSRYACCAENCNYLCPEEANLKHHIMALHTDDTSFTCPHCKIHLVVLDVEVLMKHYRLHGLLLYGCGYCSFVHHLKHKIEKHLADSHSDQPSKILTIRSMEAEPKDNIDDHIPKVNTPVIQKTTKPWRCSLCKSRCVSREDIVNHVLNKHEIDSQYKCALCTYKSNDKEELTSHFTEIHPYQKIDVISVYYKVDADSKTVEDTNSFDTTPLWQRDRPRVRHIRGILFEELPTEPGKSPKKSIKTSTPKIVPISPLQPSTSTALTNLDLSIEAVASGSADIFKEKVEESIKSLNDSIMSITKIETDSDYDVGFKEETDDIFAKINNEIKNLKKSDDDIIILVDDDDEEEDQKISDEHVTDKDCIEIFDEEGILDEYNPKNLIERYGKLGAPFLKFFKCPICNKFKTKLVRDFIYHLYQEKNYKRFLCKFCSATAISYDFMVQHMKIHPIYKIPNDIEKRPRCETLEAWIQLVLRSQSIEIAKRFPLPKQELFVFESENPVTCQYCFEKFTMDESNLEHQILHWTEKPLICGQPDCSFDGDRNDEIKKHHEDKHKGMELNVITKGPLVFDTINLNVPEFGNETANNTIENITEISADEVVFICERCAYFSNSQESIESHIKVNHANAYLFKPFRRILRKAYAFNTKSYVACAYCDLIGPDLTVREHHLREHIEMPYKPYKYTCDQCQQRYLDNKNFRAHYAKKHAGIDVKYRTLTNVIRCQSKEPIKLYQCVLCSYKSINSKTANIRMHLRTHTKPVSCGECKIRFPFNSQAKQHIRKRHPDSNATVEEDCERLAETVRILNKIVENSVIMDESKKEDMERKVARKSTSKPQQQSLSVSEFSYYGTKPEKINMKKIMTTVEVNQIGMNMTAEQLANIFDLQPDVHVERCSSPKPSTSDS